MNTFYKVMTLCVIALFSFTAQAQTKDVLTLQDAIHFTLQHNPQLAGYEFRVKALAGEQQTAALKPQLRVTTELENIGGSGEFKGVDANEFTLSLSSIIELGGQRDARLGLVTARQQQLESTQRVLTLDVLTQVTRQFTAIAASQEQLKLLQQTQQLAKENLSLLEKQIHTGRTPEADFLRAKAALARALINEQKARRELDSEHVKLSAFWADTQPAFTQVKADLFSLPQATDLQTLIKKLDTNPDLAVLGDQVHLREAELRQAQAERKSNLEWNAGVRRLQVSDDSAFVLGLSMPLGSNARASGAITTAQAHRADAELAQVNARIQLRAQLINLHEKLQLTLAEINSLGSDVLPPLKQAMSAVNNGFSLGRYSYFELNLAHNELLSAQVALIEAAAHAHLLNVDIERITGTGVVASTSDVKVLP